MFIGVFRTTKLALQNFWRNLWLSIITIFILFLTLFSISIIAGLNLAADQAIKAVKDKVDVDIFFNTETPESEVLAAQVYLQGLENVKTVQYTSPEQALENFKAAHLDDENIQQSLAELKDNPLPASLTIKAQNLNDYENVLKSFEESEYNQYVQDKNFTNHKAIIDKLSLITKRIYQIGITVSLIFVIFSLIMVFNTVRIAIYSHREELSIMRLVGATDWFIRAPFVLEAVLYALISSISTMLLLYPLVLGATPYINHLFEGYDFDLLYYFHIYVWQIFALQLFTSLILSIVSSMIAIGRYLKS